jgi:hypothetical protein
VVTCCPEKQVRGNYIFWLLVDVVLSIVVGLYYLLSHHPVMWLLALPLIAICVPLVVSKYRQLRLWRANSNRSSGESRPPRCKRLARVVPRLTMMVLFSTIMVLMRKSWPEAH